MKLTTFQKTIEQKNLDFAFFVHPDPTITYFLEAHTSYAFLLIKRKSAKVYISKLDLIVPPRGITLHYFTKKWKKELFSTKVMRIGIHKEQLNVSFFEILKKVYPKAKFIDITTDIVNLRQIKTTKEIEYITKACKYTDTALSSFLDVYKPHIFPTEQSIALYLEKQIRESGEKIAFPTIVGSGVNSSVPHHETSTKRLRKGFIQLDFGATYKNYCADMSRVLYVGTPTSKEKEDFILLQECQAKTQTHVQEGMAFGDLDLFSRKKLGKKASYFVHSLGHGIGVEVHESPKVGQGSKDIVQENMIFTIEPGIYFPGKYGIRIEDTVVFQNKKIKSLTRSSRDLKIIK
jgi:Xaa-Pro aminopeptidase